MTGIDRSTLSILVRTLLRAGLLERGRRKGDERTYSVALTKTGTRALLQTKVAAERAEAKLAALTRNLELVRFIPERTDLHAVIGEARKRKRPPKYGQRPITP